MGIPRKLGKYEILEEIGRGANAVVYKARDTVLERIVALKVIRPQLLWEQEAVERFLREAKAAAQLEHPNIVTVYEIGEEEGVYFIAMQFIPGRTVKDITAQEGPFSPERALTILRQIANALDFAHRQGFIHRDVKPTNILVTEEDRAYITDFGLVKGLAWASLTTSGGFIGTPHYISPEVAKGRKDIDGRADLYSLGVVLFEMLTGKVPFDAETPLALLRMHAEQAPPRPGELNPSIPPEVEEVVLRALAKKREERYQSGAEIAEALAKAIGAKRKPLEGEQAPEEIILSSSGEAPFTELEKAVETIAEGGTIRLRPGTYRLSQPLLISKALRLIGEEMEETIILGDGEGYVLKFEGPARFTLQNLTVCYKGEREAHVVIVSNGDLDFAHCKFSGGVGSGLRLLGETTGKVSGCIFEKNGGSGITVCDQAHPVLKGNFCRENYHGIGYINNAR